MDCEVFMTVDPTPPVPSSSEPSGTGLPTDKPFMSMSAQEQKIIMEFLQMFQKLMQSRPGCGPQATTGGDS